MLIDDQLREYDATVVRQTEVAASAEETWASIRGADLARVSRIATALSWLRALPEVATRFVRRQEPLPKAPRLTFDEVVRTGAWVVLDERAPEELVLGAVGQFWRPVIRWERVSPERFPSFDRPDFAKLAISFRVEPRGDGRSLLRYEARTATTDPAGQRHFRRYWRLIGPFAGFIMERAVDAIKRDAEELHRERLEAARAVARPVASAAPGRPPKEPPRPSA